MDCTLSPGTIHEECIPSGACTALRATQSIHQPNCQRSVRNRSKTEFQSNFRFPMWGGQILSADGSMSTHSDRKICSDFQTFFRKPPMRPGKVSEPDWQTLQIHDDRQNPPRPQCCGIVPSQPEFMLHRRGLPVILMFLIAFRIPP